MAKAGDKTSTDRARRAIVRNGLRRLFVETDDERFRSALEALEEHFPPKTRGRKKEWGDFELFILWIKVQATMRADNMDAAKACAVLAKLPLVDGRTNSGPRLESRYIEATKMLRADPESRRDAESGAEALARLRAK